MKNTIFYVIISVILIVLYTIYGATKRRNELFDKNKQEEIYQTKQNLKNFVDVAYSIIDSNYKNSMDKNYLEKHYGDRLKNIIDVAETILKSKVEKVENGKLTLAEAQAEAIEIIQNIRYNNNQGYIWINDTTQPYPKMIMHPTMPSLNAQIMDDPKYNCAMGKEQNLFIAFVEMAQKPGGGFVDYLWPKSTNKDLTTEVPKLSYVRTFPAWNWIIGTDFYIQDAILDGMEQSKEELRHMRYDNGIGFFWINNTDESFPMFYMYPIGSSIENIVLAGGQLDKLGNVIKSFIRICKQKGNGYVNYTWDKPTLKTPIKDVPKLSYVKLYEPLGWIIGTGVYIDDIDKTIARQKKFFYQQIKLLIINVLVASILLIILISILHHVVEKYFSKPAVVDSKSVKKETVTTPNPPQQVGININESLKFAQEISKIILAEQTKLLAYAISIQANKAAKNTDGTEIASNEVEQLAEKVHYSVTNFQEKMAEKIQKFRN